MSNAGSEEGLADRGVEVEMRAGAWDAGVEGVVAMGVLPDDFWLRTFTIFSWECSLHHMGFSPGQLKVRRR